MSTPRTRSPNYPVIDLEVAIDLATKFEKIARRHPYPVLAAIEKAWEMKPGSSRGLQLVGALKQFGIITDEGAGEMRKIKLTDAGARVIANVSNKKEILRELALMPKVHVDLWNHYDGNSLPPDETLTHYLQFDYQPPFNPDSIDSFLKQFRKTIEFSGLDSIEDNYENTILSNNLCSSVQEKELNDDPIDNSVGKNRSIRKIKVGMRQEIFTLDEGDVVFEWPEKLSQESYEDLESWIAIVLRKAKRAIDVKKDSDEATEE
jgi:hypothetical protein